MQDVAALQVAVIGVTTSIAVWTSVPPLLVTITGVVYLTTVIAARKEF